MRRAWCRALALVVVLLWVSAASAGETPRAMAGRPAAKLQGTWHGAQGAITFRADGILIYKGRRHRYTAANGALQVKAGTVIRQLPYRIFDGKLTITDGGIDTVYTRE